MRGRSFHPGLRAQAGLLALAACLASSVALAASTDIFSEKVDTPRKSAALVAPATVKSSIVGVAKRSGTEPSVPFGEDAADPLGMDALFDQPGSNDMSLTVLDPADWTPEHDLRRGASPRSPHDADKGVDPEPDAAIKAPTATPMNDPLDRPKPALGVKAGAGPEVSQPAGEPLPPLNAAIKAALDTRDAAEMKGPRAAERRKEREAVAFFYAAHGFAPAWSEDGKAVAAVASVLGRLARAGDDALTLPSPPKRLETNGSAADLAESDIALTEAVVSYARQATGSRVDPHAISPLIGAKPELADPAEVLDGLVMSAAQAGDKLQALNPTEPRYLVLRDKLAEMHAARMPSVDSHIPPGPTLKVGMRDPRVPLIRSRFSLGATPESDLDDLNYDTEVAAAVADFQRANGLPPSGMLTKRTIAALSGGQPSRLEGAIVANMEMWRWMPRDLGHDRIEVNVPEFLVTVFHDGEPVAQNRVVVGKTATPTPLFSNTMKYLIVNPVWNVPESIIKKEFLPKGGGDLSYLGDKGFTVTYRNGQAVVKQPSGAKNALGRVKFMFPNDYSVYLHDTPSKSLFAAAKRAFSHGCVRVDQPFAFAESVLNDGVPEGGRIAWSQKRLQKMLGDKERYVYLPEPLPIHIEYFTVGVDADSGRLQVHDDVYDYARRVAVALGQDS